MRTSVIQAELSNGLLDFLKQRGYTHILSVGVAGTEYGPDGGEDDFYLLPLKPDDPRLQYEEADLIIAAIDSLDVREMAKGVDLIRFIITIPEKEYA